MLDQGQIEARSRKLNVQEQDEVGRSKRSETEDLEKRQAFFEEAVVLWVNFQQQKSKESPRSDSYQRASERSEEHSPPYENWKWRLTRPAENIRKHQNYQKLHCSSAQVQTGFRFEKL